MCQDLRWYIVTKGIPVDFKVIITNEAYLITCYLLIASSINMRINQFAGRGVPQTTRELKKHDSNRMYFPDGVITLHGKEFGTNRTFPRTYAWIFFLHSWNISEFGIEFYGLSIQEHTSYMRIRVFPEKTVRFGDDFILDTDNYPAP